MSVAQRNPMNQPAPPADLTGWADGPLPNIDLELAAAELFADERPRGLWAEPSYKQERDQARRQILRAYVRFLKMSRWTLADAVERLTDESCQLVFGDRALNTETRGQVRDYAESYLEDLAKLFGADALSANGSRSWRYVPEDDVDDSELEDLGPKAVNQ